MRAVLDELVGLFVDDGSLAWAVLGWVLINWLLLPALGLGDGWRAAVLFLGVVAILAENTVRSARRRGRR